MPGGLRHDGDEQNFVIIPRPTVRDARLSLRALGLLTYLADLPEGWEVNAKRLERDVKEGREAIYAALRELRAAGYYRVERRKGVGGRWVSGTALAKTSRPAWAAEYAAAEEARSAGQPEPVPTWEPPAEPDPVTEGDPADTATGAREPVSREAVPPEAVSREPVPPTEELPRRTQNGGAESEGDAHVSRGLADDAPDDDRPSLLPAAPVAEDPEPSLRCPRSHPPAESCGACREARLRHEAWEGRQLDRRRAADAAERRATAERRRLALAEAERCEWCHGTNTAVLDGGSIVCNHVSDADNRARLASKQAALNVGRRQAG